jgi:hypothetical protein
MEDVANFQPGDEATAEALKLLDEAYPGVCDVRERQGGLIILNRLRPSFCKVCEKVHEHENPFLIIHEAGEVYMDCRRDSEKRWECLRRWDHAEELWLAKKLLAAAQALDTSAESAAKARRNAARLMHIPPAEPSVPRELPPDPTPDEAAAPQEEARKYPKVPAARGAAALALLPADIKGYINTNALRASYAVGHDTIETNGLELMKWHVLEWAANNAQLDAYLPKVEELWGTDPSKYTGFEGPGWLFKLAKEANPEEYAKLRASWTAADMKEEPGGGFTLEDIPTDSDAADVLARLLGAGTFHRE